MKVSGKFQCGVEEPHTTHVPCGLATREVGSNLLDLKPVGRAIGGGGRVDLGHVERNGTLVVDGLVGSEGDGGASSNRDSGGTAARVTSNIASQVLVRKVGDGAVVGNGP